MIYAIIEWFHFPSMPEEAFSYCYQILLLHDDKIILCLDTDLCYSAFLPYFQSQIYMRWFLFICFDIKQSTLHESFVYLVSIERIFLSTMEFTEHGEHEPLLCIRLSIIKFCSSYSITKLEAALKRMDWKAFLEKPFSSLFLQYWFLRSLRKALGGCSLTPSLNLNFKLVCLHANSWSYFHADSCAWNILRTIIWKSSADFKF